MIYLDNAATTKLYSGCNDVIKKYNEVFFFNPSAAYAGDCLKEIDKVRANLINILGGNLSSKIVFTGSATEANNLAILGSATHKQKSYVFSEGEHPSVYEAAQHLKNNGYSVFFVPLNKFGTVDLEKLKSILNSDVCFVSVFHVSNETGAINDIFAVKEIMKEKCSKALLHVDAVQSFCKIALNVAYLGIDLCSISAHKIHGPKGIGALYIAPNINIKNINFGGGQEGGIRSGTQNVAYIMAFDEIAKYMSIHSNESYRHVEDLRKNFIEGLTELKNRYNISCEGSPYILSITLNGIRGETLVYMLAEKQIYISTGSACSSSKIGNRTLESMGKNKSEILGSVRISFSHLNTVDEVKTCADEFVKATTNLLNMR